MAPYASRDPHTGQRTDPGRRETVRPGGFPPVIQLTPTEVLAIAANTLRKAASDLFDTDLPAECATYLLERADQIALAVDLEYGIRRDGEIAPVVSLEAAEASETHDGIFARTPAGSWREVMS